MVKRLKNLGALLVLLVSIAIVLRFVIRNYYIDSISMIKDGNYTVVEERLRRLGDYKECLLYLDLLSGIELFDAEQYEEAIKVFSSLDEFEPSKSWLYKSKYEYAKTLCENGYYESAIQCFTELKTEGIIVEDIKDVEDWINKSKYGYGQQLFDNRNYIEAINLFSELGNFEDAQERLNQAKYNYGRKLFEDGKYIEAMDVFSGLDSFEDAQEWLMKTKYTYALQCFYQNDYSEAISYFLELDEYESSAQYVEKILDLSDSIPSESLYLAAIRHYEQGLYRNALFEFRKLKDYEDSEKYAVEAEQMLRKSLATTMSVGLNGSVAINTNHEVVRTPYSAARLNRVDEWNDIVSISYFGDVAIGLKSDGSVITTSTSNIN